jgi:predicted dehydrogenase
MSVVRLLTLDPGHFHAALVQKEMYPGIATEVHVYAPLGPDLLAHLGRIAGFNARPHHATRWELEVHAAPDFLDRLLRDKPGNVVVVSGRNRDKINYLEAAANAGLHVLADKPWIIRTADFPRLEAVLDTAERRGLVACDIMTERYEITSILQRELVQDREVFGEQLAGTDTEPGVFMESVHYLMKTVAGVPLRRPVWFFDSTVQGEGLTDVGTHLVDLVMWMLFPGQAIDYRTGLQFLGARRWPTVLSREDFRRVTGEGDFPPALADHLSDGQLEYYCNTAVTYLVSGVHVKLNVLWDFEAAAGAGDTHLAVFRGTRSWVEVRQGKEQNYRPELYVSPAQGEEKAVAAALRRTVEGWQQSYPGTAVEAEGGRFRIAIPDRYRVGHEAHFGEVTAQFLQYFQDPKALPLWEKPNMLAKYWLTTFAVEKAQTNR